METAINWLILAIIISVPTYVYCKWRERKDVSLAAQRIKTIRQLLLDSDFRQITEDTQLQILIPSKQKPNLEFFQFILAGQPSTQTKVIVCLLGHFFEDKVEISFTGYFSEDLSGPIDCQLIFHELLLRSKLPRLCMNEDLVREVIEYFKCIDQLRECPHTLNHEFYAPLKSSLKDDINRTKPSKFSFLYAYLFFFSSYCLIGIFGAFLPIALISLVSLSIFYALLVWRYPYLQVEVFKWQKLGWIIASGVSIIGVGLIISPLFYPIEWANISIAMFFFFTFMLALAHASAQLAIQHLFLR